MKNKKEENSILQLQKGYSSSPVVTPPKYNVDDYQDEYWKIFEWTFTENGVKINVELTGKSVFSEVTIKKENIILRYLVRKALNATDDDLIQDLYNNFKNMTNFQLDNRYFLTQPTSSTSSSTSSSFSYSFVVPIDVGTMKTSRNKDINYVLLDFGEFIRRENRDQIIITQGYETKYYNQLNMLKKS